MTVERFEERAFAAARLGVVILAALIAWWALAPPRQPMPERCEFDARLYERDSMHGGRLTGWSQCIGQPGTLRWAI